MESLLHAWLIFIYLTSNLSHCTEEFQLVISNNEETVTIAGREFNNPCNKHPCPSGKVCTIQYTPRLLKFPLAYCAQSTAAQNEGMCIGHTVGTNMLRCKSEEEWNGIGINQCVNTTLMNTKVKHACFMTKLGQKTFLTATFNCCRVTVPTTTTTELETEAIQPLKLKDEENVAIFVVLGVALILAASLTIFALAIRCRHNNIDRVRSSKITSMSIINPEMENDLLDSNDKSILVFNEQVSI